MWGIDFFIEICQHLRNKLEIFMKDLRLDFFLKYQWYFNVIAKYVPVGNIYNVHIYDINIASSFLIFNHLLNSLHLHFCPASHPAPPAHTAHYDQQNHMLILGSLESLSSLYFFYFTGHLFLVLLKLFPFAGCRSDAAIA